MSWFELDSYRIGDNAKPSLRVPIGFGDESQVDEENPFQVNLRMIDDGDVRKLPQWKWIWEKRE